MDGQSVIVGGERDAGEVDVDAGGAVAARTEPVGPRRQQRQAGGVTGPQRVDATRQREVLVAASCRSDTPVMPTPGRTSHAAAPDAQD